MKNYILTALSIIFVVYAAHGTANAARKATNKKIATHCQTTGNRTVNMDSATQTTSSYQPTCQRTAHAAAAIGTMASYKKICTEFESYDTRRMDSFITLENCNPSKIRDAACIKEYLKNIRTLINVTQHDAPQLTHIDRGGYSVTQVIDPRGRINIDFYNSTNSVHINIFTTSPHEPTAIANYSTTFFNAQDATTEISYRK